jgi:NADP-dependent 3-hydroxy acid dehydrogenase YdfG
MYIDNILAIEDDGAANRCSLPGWRRMSWVGTLGAGRIGAQAESRSRQAYAMRSPEFPPPNDKHELRKLDMNAQTNSVRSWLITGTSSGFGRELATAALRKGDRVVATARNTAKIQDLKADYGDAVEIVRLDVTEPASIAAALDHAVQAFGRIDVLVNNAGFGLFGTVEEVSDSQIRDVFETNVFGVLNVTRAALPILRKQGTGHVLNITSNGGRFALPGLGIYHGTKFAVEGISETLAQEIVPFGIKLTIIEPGGFSTDYETRSLAVGTPMKEYDAVRTFIDEYAADYIRSHPADAAQAMLKIVELDEPPLRVALGTNVNQHLIDKLSSDIAEYRGFEHIWASSSERTQDSKWGWRQEEV